MFCSSCEDLTQEYFNRKFQESISRSNWSTRHICLCNDILHMFVPLKRAPVSGYCEKFLFLISDKETQENREYEKLQEFGRSARAPNRMDKFVVKFDTFANQFAFVSVQKD